MLETLEKIAATDEVKMHDTSRQSAGKAGELASLAEIGWLAGIWDGEGSIGMHKHTKHKYRGVPRCSVTNTDFAIIEECAVVLSKLSVGHFIRSREFENARWNGRKDLFVTGHKRVLKLLEAIGPYLKGQKQLKAKLVLSFVYSRLLKPGGGRGRGGVPYDATELRCIELISNEFNGNPNEHTPELIDEINKMCSGLHRQYAEAAEMTARQQLRLSDAFGY